MHARTHARARARTHTLIGGVSIGTVRYQWLDEHFSASEYVQDWTPFEHPQLGPVEIGGLDTKRCIQNPPPALLEEECAKNTAFSLALLGSLPAVSAELTAEPLTVSGQSVGAGGGFAVRLTLHLVNVGFLPTYGTARAVEMKAVRAHGLASLRLPDGVSLLHGEHMVEVAHLTGRSSAFDSESTVTVSSYGASPANTHEAT